MHRGYKAGAILIGLAYITRPEGTILIAVLATIIWVDKPQKWFSASVLLADNNAYVISLAR